MDKLKSCPFCGAPARHGYNGAKHIVVCTHCGIRKPAEGGRSCAENAANEWNDRARQWIPVSERLPTKDDADENGYVYLYSENMKQRAFGLWMLVEGDRNTTHWMPMPEHPEVNDER